MKNAKNILKGCIEILLSPIYFILLMTAATMLVLFLMITKIGCKFTGKHITDVIKLDIRNCIQTVKDEVKDEVKE